MLTQIEQRLVRDIDIMRFPARDGAGGMGKDSTLFTGEDRHQPDDYPFANERDRNAVLPRESDQQFLASLDAKVVEDGGSYYIDNDLDEGETSFCTLAARVFERPRITGEQNGLYVSYAIGSVHPANVLLTGGRRIVTGNRTHNITINYDCENSNVLLIFRWLLDRWNETLTRVARIISARVIADDPLFFEPLSQKYLHATTVEVETSI